MLVGYGMWEVRWWVQGWEVGGIGWDVWGEEGGFEAGDMVMER